MSIKIYGLEELTASIEQGGQRAVKGVFEEMQKVAKEIQARAREFAPIDKGDLEKAIKIAEAGGDRDDFGRFQRKSLEIYVDLDMDSSDGSGHTLADYAYEMHEYLTPYGPMKLGPRSRAKQMTTNGTVGGGYLERAIDEISDSLVDRLARRSASSL